ncbi:unnamed protein product [Pocillopora meandrina]|uniref:Uncharacterized protein n=1 Tax=Pocillopora meandrina TaxID=46732 RepID=A0AAU9WNV9_9CNID|nr:unnamed protein product [Pocillopora meandrina]
MSGLSKVFGIPSVASTTQEGQENRALKVTLLSREWRSSTDGDLSTINRELAIQLAKHSNVEVSVFLPECSEEDRNDAACYHVQLVEAEKVIGWNPVDWLINPRLKTLVRSGQDLGEIMARSLIKSWQDLW